MTSPWMERAALPARGPLREDVVADVCVVGAGLAGLTAAYQLAREGAAVAVLDAEAIGRVARRRATAHLSCAMDERCAALVRTHGPRVARLVVQGHGAAIDFIEATCAREAIACDLARVDGYLVPHDVGAACLLDDEERAARDAGLAVARVSRTPLDGLDAVPALRFPGQAQLHPLRYLAGLAEAVERLGGRIFEHSLAVALRGGPDATVLTRDGSAVACGAIVVTPPTAAPDTSALVDTSAAYRAYALAARVPDGAVPAALYRDTAEPCHHARLLEAGGRTLLLVSGEAHRAAAPACEAAHHARLDAWARARVPALGAVEHRWSVPVVETPDGLPVIGRMPRAPANVFVASGELDLGMTRGTIAGLVLGELVMGREHPWAWLYAPDRDARGPAAAAPG